MKVGTRSSRASSRQRSESLVARSVVMPGVKSPARMCFSEPVLDLAAAARADGDDVGQEFGVGPGGDAEGHRLGEGGEVDVGEHVVDDLEEHAHAGAAAVKDVFSEGLEEGPEALESRLASADHESEGSGLGAAHAAAHGGVHELHAPLLGEGREFADERGRDSTGLGDDGALGGGLRRCRPRRSSPRGRSRGAAGR